MWKKVRVVIIIVVLVAVVFGTQKMSDLLYKNFISEDVAATTEKAKIVIDSGHGGTDPGKIGINGTLEKDVNLKIAYKLKKLLEEQGVEVVMTRETGEGLADSKADDMKKRIDIINKEMPILCVSIHQNSYSDEMIKGAQVFYYTHSKKGEQVAELLQQELLKIDTDNTRQKKANDTYYVLKKSEVPTVIIECGFLSNRKEAELLSTDEYQQKMAEAIASGIEKYLE